MEKSSRILLRFATVFMVVHILPVRAYDHVTSKLFEDLFENTSSPYKQELLPLCEKEKNIVVQLDIALRQIISLDEKAQILHTNIWIRLEWPDCRLSWKPSEYGGVNKLVVPYSSVWTPDLALYDSSAEEEMMPGRDEFRAQINFTGDITYNFPTVLTSVCKVKVTYFPFDTQNCSLQLGSWSYSLSDIDIRSKAAEGMNGDLSDFLENNEWEVVRLDAIRILKSYSFGQYPDVRYFIIIKRRPQFYVMTMLFPCILVSAIATIGFLLPAESGEKVSLEVTVLLSLAVFLLVISDFLPPSAEQFPIIGTYFAVAMVMVSFSLVLSVLVLNIHHRGENGKEVPGWIRNIFLERIGQMCVKSKHRKYSPDSNLQKSHCDSVQGTFNTFEMNDDKPHENHVNQRTTIGMRDSYTTDFERLIGDQADSLHGITEHLKDRNRQDKVCEEWRALARIVDRLLLLTYVTISVIVTLVFLLPLNSNENK